MKVFFYLLLLINIAFFGYHYTQVESFEVAQPWVASGDDTGNIQLLSEVERAVPVEKSTTGGAPETAVGEVAKVEDASGAHSAISAPESAKLVESCFELRGFASEEDAKKSLDALLDSGFTGSVDSYAERVLGGYWVLTPRYRTRNEALKIARQMQAVGVDSFIIESGEDKNAISVGLFKNKNNAGEFKEDVARLGFSVSVKEQHREVSHYKLALSYRGLKTAPSPIDVVGKAVSTLTSAEKACANPTAVP